jgi:hypothetical protein
LIWSAILDILIFIYLKLHQEKPIAAYVLSLPAILLFLIFFRVPVLSAK